jgi:hypothetical protein
MHPKDGNYVAPPGVQEVHTDNVDTESSQSIKLDAALHAYASATAYDAAANSSQDCGDLPQETEASAVGNRTVPIFPSAPPLSASAVHMKSFRTEPIPSYCPAPTTAEDVNSGNLPSPPHVFVQTVDSHGQGAEQSSWEDSPALPATQRTPVPTAAQSAVSRGTVAPNQPGLPQSPSPTR